jgi:hypothetical protein
MKKLNIRNKETHILVLFGLLTLLFISVNLVNNHTPQDNFTFDDKFPTSSAISINIISPSTNEYFNATAPDFVVEIDDPVNPINTMWYTINGGATNITFTVNGTIDQNNWTAIADGLVTITFYANNSISEELSASVNINKDAVGPSVSITSPTGGEYFDATAPSYVVEITDSESPIDSMWYTLNGGVNIFFTVNGTIDQNNWTALGNGPVTMVFYANDSAGNTNSDMLIVNKDVSNPVVLITTPTGGEYFDATAPSYVVEIDDAESPIDSMWYTLNGGVNIFFTVNGTIDQNNWTILGNGPVTIIFFANDSAGNVGSDTAIVNKDAVGPSVSITSPTGGEYFDATAPSYVVEIDDAESPIDSMWYTLNGGVNIFFTVNGTIDQNNWTILGNGPVTIIFFANDSAGNVGSDTVVVNKDASNPAVLITTPTGGEYFDATAPSFFVEITDSESPIDSRWYTLNGGVNIFFTVNGTIDQNNWTALADGLITIIFFANDSAGNINFDTVVVNKDATDPSVSITSQTGGEYYGATAPGYTVEIGDNNLELMWYTLNGGANIFFTVNGTIDQNNWTALADGSITIIFFANDTAGNVAFDQVIVNKDTTAPTIIIISPTGGTYGVAAPDLTVQIYDDTLDTMWYTIDGGATNITFTSNGTIDPIEWSALGNGPVTLTFYANDTFGLMNSTFIDFSKNADAPVITIVSPTSDSNYGTAAPGFIVRITDPDLHTMWYTIDGGVTNITFLANETIDQNNWTAHIDGAVTIIFYANDTFGNLNSRSVVINKDTVVPTVNIVSIFPTLNQLLGVISPSFIVEIDDPILDTMWYSLNDGLTNYTFVTNGTINQLAWDSVSNGTVRIYFYANDLAGNEAFDSILMRVDKDIPTITVNLPVDDTVIGTRPFINITVYDTNVDSIWYIIAPYSFIILTNNTNQQLPLSIWNALPEGSFTIELFANDTAGNLNNLYTIDLTKDTLAPTVIIVHPLANTRYTNAPQITLTINDATLDTTWYTIVGTNYTFEFTPVPGTNIVNINQAAWNALSNGNVTFVFYANDSLGRISSDSITLDRNVPEPFDFIAFLFGPVGLTIMGVAVAIVVIVILLKRRKTHKTSDKEVRKIESLWD